MTVQSLRQKFSKRTLWSFVVIGCAIALSAGAGSLWLAESKGTLKLDALDGAVVLEIPESPYGSAAVSVDPTNGNVWTWGEQRLRAFDSDGVEFLDVESTSYPYWDYPADLLIDGDAGNVWLNLGNDLYRLNLSGQVVGSLLNYGTPCDSLTLDRDRSRIWVCTTSSVKAYNASLQQVVNLSISGTVSRTAWDANRDELWVAVNNKLRRYDPSGTMTFEMTNPAGSTNTYFLRPDGQGGIWLGTETQFVYIDPTGAVGSWMTPFNDFSPAIIIDAVVHPLDASIWIGNETHVRRFSTAGTELQERFLNLGDGFDRYLANMDLFEDLTRPAIEFSAPTNNSSTNDNTPELRLVFVDPGSGIDEESLVLTLNNAPLAADCEIDALGAECTPLSALSDGVKVVTATISDTSENESDAATVQFTVDTVAPQITITSPTTGTFTNQENIVVMGGLSEAATLRINGTLVGLDGTNNFTRTVALEEGGNTIAVVATDNATNSTTRNLSITLDTQAPNIPNVGFIGVSNPSVAGLVTITGAAGSVEANALVLVTNVRTGLSVTVSATAEGAFSAQIAGEEADQLQIRAIDNAQNQSQPGQTTVPGALPPNPASVATPLSTTGIVPFGESTAFLYTGTSPIQTGVASGTIQAEFAAVVRGSVTTRAGVPLPNVVVTIKDQSQYGQTRTRADGRFDLAINGGSTVIIDYQRQGYLPIHRVIDVRHNAFALAANVVMIPVDAAVTEIALNTTTLQSHQSSIATDYDGARRVTLMVPASTTATMTLANGSTQALGTSMRIRATEYTVGINGPEAMPGALPATSAYTYAVDLTVDEAIAAGATRVDFNQPLPVYVDNFLGFDVGAEVPVGFYDRGPAAWIPSENGRIVEILSISGGLANLDIDGSEQPANAQELASLGITTAERQRLALLYEAGDSLWRFRVAHFTPWDCNWPYDLAADAVSPPPMPSLGSDGPDGDETPECEGCAIDPHNQSLSESIPIVGTRYSLHYSSARARALLPISIDITGPTVPDSLAVIMVKVEIAGREIYNTTLGSEYSAVRVQAEPNQTIAVAWDGRDAYGRLMSGTVMGKATITYGYIPSYSRAGSLMAFGLASSTGTSLRSQTGAANGLEPRLIFVDRTQHFRARAGGPALGHIGGWTLSPQQTLDVFDPNTRVATLYSGDGSWSQVGEGRVLIRSESNFAGTLRGVAVSSAGGIYQARSSGHLVAGTTILAGGGANPPTTGAVGTTVSLAPLTDVYHASVEAYFLSGNQLWSYSNGRIFLIAGTGTAGSTGDGGPAVDATLASPTGVVVDPISRTIFISESAGHRIRRISADGTITTYAGTGTAGFSGDTGLATNAQLSAPRGLALSRNGTLFVADSGNRRIRSIEPTGRIRTVAGNGTACSDPETSCGDSGLATGANLTTPVDVAVYPNDEFVIADVGTRKVRAVRHSGTIVTISGDGTIWTGTPGGEGGPAARASLSDELSLAVDSRGAVVIGDRGYVRKLVHPAPSRSATSLSVPVNNGAVLAEFDLAGKHLESRDALTGALVLQSGYDGAGRLTTLTDESGNVTTIERNGSGAATAIIADTGQRTELTRDSNGFLESVEDPNGQIVELETLSSGLLTSFADSVGNASTFSYNTAGRLLTDEGPDDTGWTLSRSTASGNPVVTMTSAEGRIFEFTSSTTSTGARSIISQYPDGTEHSLVVGTGNGETVENAVDGTRLTRRFAPDPRFGMAAPIVVTEELRLPSGLTRSVNTARTVTLSNQSDPLSVTSATETSSLNGRIWTGTFTGATRRFLATSPEGREAASFVDAAGRVTSSSLEDVEETRIEYDSGGRPTIFESGSGSDLRVIEIDYFDTGVSAGLPQTVTDAEGRVTTFTYDAAGRVTQETLPGNRVISYAYDANGNVTSITPPGRTAHVFEYTGINLPDVYAPPAAGLPSFATTYTYNRDRQLTRILKPGNQELELAYTASGKLETITTSRGDTDLSYNPATGQVSGVTTPEGQVMALTFDGPLVIGTTWSGVIAGSFGMSLNSDLQVSAVSVNGSSVTLGYDDDGLLISAGALAITRLLSNGFEDTTSVGNVTTQSAYNDFGELRRYDARRPVGNALELLEEIRARIAEMRAELQVYWSLKPSSFGLTAYNNFQNAALATPVNNTVLSQRFNDFRFLYPSLVTSAQNRNSCECSDEEHAAIVAAIGRASLLIVELEDLTNAYFSGGQGSQLAFSELLSRDRLGRITFKSERIEGVVTDYEYAYDSAGRLTEVEREGVVVESYTYDANGNRLTTGSTSATYDAQDRLTSLGSASYTYTASGDLLTRVQSAQTTTYASDVLGNLLSVTLPDSRIVTYVVDGSNRRVGKRIDGVLVQGFLYQSQLQVAAELDGTGAVLSRFIYGTKANVPDYMVRSGVTYRIVSDHVGSPRLVINASTGQIVQRIDYNAFGIVVGDTNPGFQPFGFAGGLYDRDTRLVRLGARDYDAEAGRWAAKDPILFVGGQTNLYAYALADPVNFVDTNGRFAWVLAGVAIGGALAYYKHFPALVRGEISHGQFGALLGTYMVAGGLSALGSGLIASTLAGGLSAGGSNAAEQFILTGTVCTSKAVRAAIIGGAISAGASAVGKLGELGSRDIIGVPLEKAGKDFTDITGPIGFFGEKTADMIFQD